MGGAMNNPKLFEIKKELESLSAAEQIELAHHLLEANRTSRFPTKVVDLSRHAGKIQFAGDALEWQHQMRAEWDR